MQDGGGSWQLSDGMILPSTSGRAAAAILLLGCSAHCGKWVRLLPDASTVGSLGYIQFRVFLHSH